MKTKPIKITNLLILLFFVFFGFNHILGQEPQPDKSTTNALSRLINGSKREVKTQNTDREVLKRNIKSSFFNWSQKGEFEKQADFEIRIQEQSQNKFAQICIEEIKKKINSFSSSDLDINLLTYDAENEVFPTVFNFKEKQWKNQVKISIDKAQNFKEEQWSNFRWQKEESNWCFISNDMFPSNIYLKNNTFDITFKLQLPNQEEIKVSFNDLGLENTYLKDFIFNYTTAPDKGREDKISSPDGIPNARIDYGAGRSLDGNGNYQLGGRKAIEKNIILQKCSESGTVVVSIEVDRNGKVISANPGVRGTTNNTKCLLEPARKMAIKTKFNIDPKAPLNQIGKIIYRFYVSE